MNLELGTLIVVWANKKVYSKKIALGRKKRRKSFLQETLSFEFEVPGFKFLRAGAGL